MPDSNISRLSPMHLSNNKNYEIQRTNHFQVTFDGLSDEFMFSVESTSIPTISVEPITLSYGNSSIKVAGMASFDDVSLTIRDFIGINIQEQLMEWFSKVYDPETDVIGWSADYKRNGILYQYAPDGTHERSWDLIGCWPTSFESGDFSYEGSDKKTIAMTIAVDKAYAKK